jgi:SAM-dependent methyltransferase
MSGDANQHQSPADELSDILYEDYVRGFKGIGGESSEVLAPSKERWLSLRLLPLLAHLSPDAVVHEVGCGDGHVLGFLRSRGFRRVKGVDRCADQVRIAQGRGLDVECGDLFGFLAGSEGSVDAVIAIDLIEHLDRTQLPAFAHAVWRALRPGGTFLLQTPNGEGLFAGHVIYGDLTHRTIFNASSLQQFLRAFGFDGIQVGETGPVSNGLVGTLRMVIWNVVRFFGRLAVMAESGRKPIVMTQEILCSCRKAAAH